MEPGNNIYTQFIAEVEEYAIITMDESGGIMSWNKGAEKIKGYQPEEIIGSNFRIFYTGEDKKNGVPERLMKEAAANGKTTSQGWRVRKNGDLFWSEVCITAVYDSEKKLIGYTKILHPVTGGDKGQQIEPMTAMGQEEFDQNNLHALINNTHDLMWSVDRNYRLITSNAAFDRILCNMTGRAIQKGENVFPKEFSQKQLDHYRELYDRALAGEIFKVTEYADAPVELWSELSFYPIYEGTEVVGTACFSHNITERKKAHEKVRQSEANLRTIFESSSETFLLTDRDGIIITFNTRAQDTTTIANGTDLAVGRNILDLIKDERKNSFKEMFARAASGETVQYNLSFTGTEDHPRYFEFALNPVYDNGDLTGLCINGRETTERHLVAAKMECDEKRYQALVENSNDAVVILSGDFKPIYASPSIQRVLGYSAEEALKLDVFSLIHPDDIAPAQEALARSIASPGIPVQGHTGRMLHRDGTWHWYEATITNMLHDPAIGGFVDNFRDVTEKKMLEDRLAEERKIFTDLFQQAPSYICMLKGPDHLYEIANPPYLHVTGRSNIIGMRAVDVFPELVDQGYAGLLDHVYNTGEPYAASESFIQIDTDGSGRLTDHYMNFVYQPYRNLAGKIEGIFFFANLVTEQVEARRKIEQREKHFRALIENAGDIISLTDTAGTITYASPAIQRITGYTMDEVIGKTCFSMLHPDTIDETIEFYSTLLTRPGELIDWSNRYVHKNGSDIWVEGTVVNLLEDENVRAILANFRDVTARKQAEEKVLNVNRLYAFISAINQTIVHAEDEYSVFNDVCRIAYTVGGFDMAWVGLFDADYETINLVAEEGITDGEKKLFKNKHLEKNGPQSSVLKASSYYVCNDVETCIESEMCKSFAARYGMRSCMVLPVRKAGRIIGTLNLYSSKADLFDDDEIRLLQEVTDDISFAADVFEKERHRKEMERRLKHSELRLIQAQTIAHLGSWEYDLNTGITTCSDEYCRIYGLPKEHKLPSMEAWIALIHPDDRAYAARMAQQCLQKQESVVINHRILLWDGTIKHIKTETQFAFDDRGAPVSVYGIAHDITGQKKAEEKLINATRLYSFTSNINQTVVHATDKQTVFDEACRIAVEYGKFELAWISMPDKATRKLNLAAYYNAQDEDLDVLSNFTYDECGPTGSVLSAGSCYVINDFLDMPDGENLKNYALGKGFRSSILLPIRKGGVTIGTYNLMSTQANLFDTKEIRLLTEAADNISFALDVFRKEKQRKQMEHNLKYSKARLKQAQAIAHVGSWEMDLTNGISVWSEESCRIYGLSADENKQSFDAWLSFIHPEDLPAVLEILEKNGRQKSSYSFDHRIVRRNGEIRHLFSEGHFEYNNNGEPTGMYGVAHDITEIRKAEDALAQSEANLRLIMDLIPQSIFVKDINGRFLFSNKSFADIHGLTPSEIMSMAVVSSSDEVEARLFLDQDQRVIQAKEQMIIPEAVFTDGSGKRRIFHCIKVPFTMAGTNETAVLGILLDITRQKHAEMERAKIIQDIVNRNNDLEQFSYIVSHNLRAPVANILGLVNIINTIGISESDEQEVVGYLSSAATNLDNVIRDINYILDLKHDINEKKERISFRKLLEEVRMSIDNTIHDQHVIIKSDFSAAPGMNTVKSYLYSILTNLISNSIKYRRPDVNPLIEISTFITDGKIHIRVKDNGMGIDLKKESQSVFGLYKRFHFHVEGKGMGLFMVKTQVETLGGKISVSSEVNKGTEFNIEFDLKQNIN